MTDPPKDQIIDRRKLHELVPYSDAHLLRLEKSGCFPRRVKLGANRVGWLLSEILSWINERKRARLI